MRINNWFILILIIFLILWYMSVPSEIECDKSKNVSVEMERHKVKTT